MTQLTQSLPDMIRDTLRDPRGAARRIIAMDLPLGPLWEALALVVVLSVIVAEAALLLTGAYTTEAEMILPGPFFSPVILGVVQGVLLVLMVLAIHVVGRMFGGTGELSHALVLVVWLQFLMVVLQALQGVTMIVLPFLSSLIGIAGVVGFFYLLTQFVCELHGFNRPGMVFGGILATMVVIIFLLSILLGILGIGVVEIPDV